MATLEKQLSDYFVSRLHPKNLLLTQHQTRHDLSYVAFNEFRLQGCSI